jgi:hypothetical protein
VFETHDVRLRNMTHGSLLHRAFHVLANIEIEDGGWSYAADLCFSHPMRPRPSGSPGELRYYEKTPITHVVLRDARAFLHMACALSLFEELGKTVRVGSESMDFKRGWHYCIYCPEDFATTASSQNAAERATPKELSFSRKVRCRADDHAFAFGGGVVVLEWTLMVCDDGKYARMRQRIPALMMGQQNAYEWLHACPDYPYIEALKRQPLLDARDVFTAYDFLFYVCLENCSAHLSAVGSVVARDPVSGRPLCFRIRDQKAFCERVLIGYTPSLSMPGARPPHEMLDTTRVGPLVLSDDLPDDSIDVAVKTECGWRRKLARLYRQKISFRVTGGVFLSEMLYEFAHATGTNTFRLLYDSPQPCLLHLSLYAPKLSIKTREFTVFLCLTAARAWRGARARCGAAAIRWRGRARAECRRGTLSPRRECSPPHGGRRLRKRAGAWRRAAA